jgi:type IV secretion system protein VirB5
MSIFGRKAKKAQQAAEAAEKEKKAAESPYYAARSEWNERYGSYISQTRSWRVVAIVSLCAMVLAVIGLVFIGAQSKVVPYIVEVDKIGNPVQIRRAEAVQRIDPRLIRSILAEFIVNVRSVSPDAAVNRQRLAKAYAYLTPSSPATMQLNQYFKEGNNPNQRAQTETATVEISNILPLTKDTWQIEWTETVRGRSNGATNASKMKATATLMFAIPSSDEQLLLNPMGLFWTDFTPTKLLQ